MQIDNVEAAQDLCDRLEATIPFPVRPTKQLLKIMIEGGNQACPDDVFTVDWVKYSGDVGGINCAFEYSKGGERYAVSLTHLIIDPEHPLAEEVVAYQQRRVRLLKLQDRGGFAANLLANTTQPKRSKGGAGFGRKQGILCSVITYLGIRL